MAKKKKKFKLSVFLFIPQSSALWFKSQLCCALRCTSENPASRWPLLLMQCVCSVSRCCLAPQIIMILFLWRLFQAVCFLHVLPTTWWVIMWEYLMFLKLNRPLFRKLFTELLQFICCCCSSHVQVNQLCRDRAQLSPRSNPGAPSCSGTDSAISQISSAVQCMLLPGITD